MNEKVILATEICGNQSALARVCGVSQPTVNGWINGASMDVKYIPAIIKATEGKIRDQIDAAIMTPEAKPSNNFCIFGLISFLSRNTIAAPSDVPINGNKMPRATVSAIFPPVNVNLYSLLL